jgi:ABC-type transport system involved in multi-copper enzyme maturation permease subunit
VNGAYAVARYTLIELSRRRILLVMFLIGFAGILFLGVGLRILYDIGTSGTLVTNGRQVDPALVDRFLDLEFVFFLIGALGIFALVISYGIGMTAIYHDLDSGGAVSIFSKPVTRLAYAAGKIGAALGALVIIIGLLAIEARIVILLFGGGLENALTGEVLATVANSAVVMLIVLSLSTWINNIVAAIVAFVYSSVVGGVIVYLHNLATTGVIANGFWRGVMNVLYWLIPHQLTSSATGDLVQVSVQFQAAAGTTPTSPAVPPASGAGDLAWWAFTLVFFAVLVYYSVRRRQV